MRVVLASIMRVLFALCIASAFYLVVVFLTVWNAGVRDSGEKGDAIVVMGAAQYDGRPSPLLESRLQHALEMWRDEQRAPLVAVTGGKQEGDRFTEAQASRQWLIDAGVDKDAIISEEVGRSTWESLEALAPLLHERGVQRVVMVTTDWHAARSALSLEDLGFSVTTSGVAGLKNSQPQWLRETFGVAFGRILGFKQLFAITG